MATATITKRTRTRTSPGSDWLAQLLADVRHEVQAQPSTQSVARIRARLAAELKFPSERAAA
jgi:hypothetical protein